MANEPAIDATRQRVTVKLEVYRKMMDALANEGESFGELANRLFTDLVKDVKLSPSSLDWIRTTMKENAERRHLERVRKGVPK